jgi:hypothetical protein
MDTCPHSRWVTRVRDALLIAAAGLAVSTSPLANAGDQNRPSVTSLLRRLDDPRFEIRTAAERELTRLEAVDLPVLEMAATHDAEQAARIVALLERLYVGDSAQAPDQNVARSALLSSLDAMLAVRRAGDFGETDLTKAAEEVLTRLAQGDSPAAPVAEAALARHAVLAESRAITTLRRLGAKIVFSERKDAMHEALSQLAEGAAPAPPAEGTTSPSPLAVEHVYILRSWKGSREGLKYLSRLRTAGGLQLYLVDGCGLTLEDILPLKAEIPGLTPVERSAATLGVRSSGYQQFLENGGCEIAGVSEGLAADKAGLRNSFIIKAVNGDPIVTFDDGTSKSLVHRLRDCAPGETVTLTVQRTISAQTEEVQVTLSDWSDVADVQMIGR